MEFLSTHMMKAHEETLDKRISRLAEATKAELKPPPSMKGTICAEPSKLLDCSECGNFFNYQSEMEAHIEREHSKETRKNLKAIFKCRECNFMARSEEELKEHKREENQKAKAKYAPPESLKLCTECDKKNTISIESTPI